MGDAEAIAVDNGHVVFPRGGREAIQQTFWTLGGFLAHFLGQFFELVVQFMHTPFPRNLLGTFFG